MGVTIRLATPDDAAAAAACHIACWREAYAGIVDPTVLAARSDDLSQRTTRWRQAVTDLGPRWLAVEPAGDVVGFAAAGPARDVDTDGDIELYALYVRAVHYGTGLGDRLLVAAIADSAAYLWVFEANRRARAFYARHGFRLDGARKDELFLGEPEVRMRRA